MLKTTIASLTPTGRRRAAQVLVILVLSAILETTGVASILPFLLLVSQPKAFLSHPKVHDLYAWGHFQSEREFSIYFGFFVMAVLCSSNLLSAYSLFFSTRMAAVETASLGEVLLARYFSKDYLWFLSQNSNVLGRNVILEVGSVTNGVVLPVLRVIARGLVSLLIIVGLLLVNATIASFTALLLGGAYALTWHLARIRLSRLGFSRMALEAKRSRLVKESLAGIKTSIVLNRELYLLESYRETSIEAGDVSVQQVLLIEGPRFVMETLAFGGVIAILLYLILTRGEATEALPILSIFTLGAYRLIPALQVVFASLGSIRGNQPVVDALQGELNSQGTAFVAPELCEDRIPFRSKIRLEEISFCYPEKETPAVQQLSLEISCNTSVAFVGYSGSGKTTLIDILLGLLRPQEGSIFIDDTRLEKCNLRLWQNIIGYVSQDIYLTDDTIRSNVAFGIAEDEIDHARVEEACKLANLHDYIVSELEHGYDSKVGERGSWMSGGQCQRVGIARALYHQPKVLVLDEATSALDGATESAVLKAVNDLSDRITIIMIAHRLTTVRNCDQIFFLKQGQLADQGTYSELSGRNEEFRRLAKIGELTEISD